MALKTNPASDPFAGQLNHLSTEQETRLRELKSVLRAQEQGHGEGEDDATLLYVS